MTIAAFLVGWPRPLISQHRADALLKETAKTGYQFLRPRLDLRLKEIGW